MVRITWTRFNKSPASWCPGHLSEAFGLSNLAATIVILNSHEASRWHRLLSSFYVIVHPNHPRLPRGDFPGCSWTIRWVIPWPVAVGLQPTAPLGRIPLIDDDLGWHGQPPGTPVAFCRTGVRVQTPVAVRLVYIQRRGNTALEIRWPALLQRTATVHLSRWPCAG